MQKPVFCREVVILKCLQIRCHNYVSNVVSAFFASSQSTAPCLHFRANLRIILGDIEQNVSRCFSEHGIYLHLITVPPCRFCERFRKGSTSADKKHKTKTMWATLQSSSNSPTVPDVSSKYLRSIDHCNSSDTKNEMHDNYFSLRCSALITMTTVLYANVYLVNFVPRR